MDKVKIENIIFDFDGVLVDNMKFAHELHSDILEPLSKKEFKDFFKGNSLKKGTSKYSPDKFEKFFDKWREYFKTLHIDKKEKKFLEKINNKKLFIVSSNEEGIINDILEREKIGYFIDVLGKESGHCKKEKIESLVDKYNVDLDKTIFITDSLGDIKEGNLAGVKSIGVTWGVHEREMLEEGNPCAIVDSWEELGQIFYRRFDLL